MAINGKKIIIDVAPLTRLPLTKSQSFSYLHDQKLAAGTLVSIPLFHRKVSGIVTGNRPDCVATQSVAGGPDFERLGNIHPVEYRKAVTAPPLFHGIKLKKIESVIEENFLDKKQIELANFISEYYFSPLGIVLKSFVPKIVKQRKKKISTFKEKPKPSIILTKEQQKAVDEIAKNKKLKTKNYLLYGPAGSGKTEIYIHSILKLKEKNKGAQFLILLPELTLTPQAMERYGEYFKPEETVVLNSKISKGQFYSNWQKIKSGNAKIIIGSRMAVFAPFQNLSLIIVDEEQDMSFKQWDMNPRYDARTVGEKLAEIHKAKIVFGSATPGVETYHKANKKGCKLLTIPYLRAPRTKIEIIDMKKERWAHNYSIVSKKFKEEIAYALKNNLQIIIFVNRQGMSNFSICKNCRKTLKCPKCDRALIYGTEGFYHCVHCTYKSSILVQCQNCRGINFENIGIGTQKVEKEISNFFPSAKIIRADNQTLKVRGTQENLYEKFSHNEASILIGTQVITKGWDLPNVALVGIIDGDAMLSIPDFSATARAFQNAVQLLGRAERPKAKFPGVMAIQTFYPENNLFQSIVEKNFEKFYQKELEERKQLSLPPFVKIIKLIFQDRSLKKASQETERIYIQLQEKLGKNISITEPQDSFVNKMRGRFRRQIIIKIKSGKITENIAKILKKLEKGWIIDVDPISII